MKFKLVLDPCREEECLVYAKEESQLTGRIKELVEGQKNVILGYTGTTVTPLSEEDIYAVAIEGGRLYAITENKRYELKMRLYEIEKIISERFVRINQSCLISISSIAAFDISIGGGLLVRLKNGYTDYVSRRQLKSVKERIGIK